MCYTVYSTRILLFFILDYNNTLVFDSISHLRGVVKEDDIEGIETNVLNPYYHFEVAAGSLSVDKSRFTADYYNFRE